MKIKSKKMIPIASFLIAVTLICEVVLRIGGHFQGNADRLSEEELKKLTEADVVCIGNSHTSGFGLPEGDTFCDQLQKIAQENGYELRTQNWGKALFNTAAILRDLKEKIPPAKPKIALVMAGESNLVDFRGFIDFQKRRRGDRETTSVKPAQNTIWKNSAPLKTLFLIQSFLKKSEDEDSNANLWPFPVVDSQNQLEIAYRWLTWARSNFWEVRLNDRQAKALLDSMKLIKETDPSNIAADLVASEVEAIHFQNPEKALEILKLIPKSHEACLGLLEAPSLEGLSRDLPILLQRRLSPNTSGQYVQALLTAQSNWNAKFTSAEKALLEKIIRRQTITTAAPNVLDKSKKMRNIFETLSDCGSVDDGTVAFLMASYLRTADYNSMLSLMLHQVQIFPLSTQINSLQILNFVRQFLKPNPKIDEKVQLAYKTHNAKFGDLSGENRLLSKSETDQWAEDELTEIVNFLGQRGIKVVLMTYPPLPHRGVHPVKQTPIIDLPSSEVDTQIRKVSEASNVPVFDTYTTLRQQFLGVKGLKQFYSLSIGPLDPHLNSAGNKALGEDLYKYLDGKNLLSSFKE